VLSLGSERESFEEKGTLTIILRGGEAPRAEKEEGRQTDARRAVVVFARRRGKAVLISSWFISFLTHAHTPF